MSRQLLCAVLFLATSPLLAGPYLAQAPAPLTVKSGSKAQVAVTLQPNTYQSFFVDLPSNVSVLSASTLASTGDTSLYVKQGVPHTGTSLQALGQESAYIAATASLNEQISATRGSTVPLTPGRWWFTPTNVSGQVVTLTLDVTYTVAGAPFALAAGQSGTWYDPRKNYQGFFFEVMDATTALVVWFTFTPEGQQAYMVGIGTIAGDQLGISNLVRTRGGRFGPDFDPSTVIREDWGDLVFTFDGCNSGYASYLPSDLARGQGWPPEQLDMDRITTISGLSCSATATASKYLFGGISGAWFDPTHDGEGWLVEVLNATTALVYWFSYTPDGRQAWFGNVGRIVNGTIVVEQALQPSGGRFGPNYNASQVTLQPWGGFALTMTGCNEAVGAALGPPTFGFVEFGYVARITALAGTSPCAFPVNVSNISGRARAPINTFVDGDVNDPNVPNRDNDLPTQEQAISNPATVLGYLATTPTGTTGDRFATANDIYDAYTLSIAAGQVVKLGIADHKASNPSEIDLDIRLYQANDPTTPVAVSEGTGPIEQIQVAQSGEYDILVLAYQGRSNYVLSVDNSGVAAAAIADALSIAAPIVRDEVIVAIEGPTELDAAEGRSQAKAHAEAYGLQFVAGSADRSMLLALGDKANKRLAASKLGLVDAPDDDWAIGDPESRARHEVNLFVKALRARPGVRYAEPNYIQQAFAVPNDPGYRFQWHYPQINLPQAWDLTTGDPSVVVAVVDTGIGPHPELTGVLRYDLGLDAIRDAFNSLDGTGIDRDANDPGDRSSPDGSSSFHGTHVAGTVSMRSNDGIGVAGTGWRTTLMPVRVLGRGGRGDSYDIAQGVRWAAGLPNDSGTTPTQRAAVINLSLGGLSPSGCPAEYAAVFNAVRANGVIVVAAAGNESTSIPSVPAACPGVISVSAVDINSRLAASYSNFGPTIDIAAPGGDTSVDLNADGAFDGVLSTIFDDRSGAPVAIFDFLDGTSMAAPHVAGVAALMKAVFPSLSPTQFDGLLASGSITRDLAGNGASVRDDQFGFGLVDAFKAVGEARRLAGNQTLPAVTAAAPTSLDFGATATAGSVSVSNIGQGSASVSSASTTQPWLRASPAQVNAQGLGTYSISVDRTGLVAASYRGEVRFATSTGPISVQVGMRVGQPISAGNLGTQYVLLVDNITGVTVKDAAVTVGGAGDYSFSSLSALPNDYIVFAGSDLDNDQFICDAGESCGAYSSLDQPSLIQLRSANLNLPEFAVTPDTGLIGSSTPAVANKSGKRIGAHDSVRRR